MTTKQVSNILNDEDGQVSFEQFNYHESEWKEHLDDCEVLSYQASKEQIIEELNSWVDEQKSKWDNVEYLSKLDSARDRLIEEINSVDEHKIVGYGEWGVEYDANYCIVVES